MQKAVLTFAEDGTPCSSEFGDSYFSKGEGPAETRFVFLEQNELPQRFSALQQQQNFTIAETGFGTGLNFLLAWQLFNEVAPQGARLTFVSCEKFPIERAELQAIHQQWPELAELSKQLLSQYPPSLGGYHPLVFGNVTLLLMYGDACSQYSQLAATVDAWFLDGFSPALNPDMWQPELFQHIRRLSRIGTTAATFTAARIVKDGLLGAGFKLTRSKGYGRKRHKLRGDFIGLCGPSYVGGWPCSEMPIAEPNRAKNIAIIGAGIAGISTALELTKRGYRVTVFEKNQTVASGGSGNLQGAVYAKLSAKINDATQFYAQALIQAQHILATLPNEVAHQACGLVQLANSDSELKKLQAFDSSDDIPRELAEPKTAQELSELTGIEVEHPGLWFADGGWLSPSELIRYLVKEFQLQVKTATEITEITQQENGWQLSDANRNSYQFDQLVLCNGFDAKKHPHTQHLPVKPIAGQVTYLQETSTSAALKAVICTDRYVMPTHNQQLIIGSTFRVKTENSELKPEDNAENINALHQRLPQLNIAAQQAIGGRAGIRCTSPDYLPIVGAVSEPDWLHRQFTIAVQRKQTDRLPAAETVNGLWLNIAHGSKGLCSAHYTAKILAALISGEPLPIQAELLNKLNPNRFEVRAMLRGKRVKH
ncbi:bifunctional tRNA (5-methylaminomethyl-2-thiouridine)(34)-methyltransferase MnmD/FAD-dependent 5-carboxymethylaminomethyl-2-thiouridine(34) oxidoreductase MnmC [Reinekea marinisedimentorum]|uniref:tRNA 5-methylaminomethyl-2-thiouridine biosynthesis bifunctional protein MnmC n=1 Tax=Reinekea marinisedimentorum TaxID=230495 RepID=A0A4R3HT74_9GAMM|nr:bifunctional tRNA (5-methylaminomethyl-2-thiouridine)(34)-methyltransferase MnmD/FAD-dependent 5-carboxymethylaminomethyl-2-thiouridine(34) oxidoreductase MnmC [Reinekea marinisedimentorum]TCS35894.1 tRNA 5-methylaminomethyl-2-thiouridine biosynthesis bifunctional protein [Reinekea marinisedimentorum]